MAVVVGPPKLPVEYWNGARLKHGDGPADAHGEAVQKLNARVSVKIDLMLHNADIRLRFRARIVRGNDVARVEWIQRVTERELTKKDRARLCDGREIPTPSSGPPGM